MTPTVRRVLQFIGVGCGAAAVHLGAVAWLVEREAWPPLLANPLGWLVAFLFSFAGHRLLTFAAQRAPLLQSARRFFAISAAGFVVNELAYAALLRASGLGYALALALVLLGVAVLTYLLSLHWAFRSSPTR